MSVSSRVRTCVCERERSERVKGQKEEEMYERKSMRWRCSRERQIKGQDERKRRERRMLLIKETSYAPSCPPRAKIHTLFEQHKGNGRKGDVKSKIGRE